MNVFLTTNGVETFTLEVSPVLITIDEKDVNTNNDQGIRVYKEWRIKKCISG